MAEYKSRGLGLLKENYNKTLAAIGATCIGGGVLLDHGNSPYCWVGAMIGLLTAATIYQQLEEYLIEARRK